MCHLFLFERNHIHFPQRFFNHSGFSQPSIIARIEGSSKSDEVVLLGAHGDSIVSLGATAAAPGGDDDASGVANLLETARVISTSGVKLERSVEFVVYAAEEVGLRGSIDIADDYLERGVKVFAAYQARSSLYFLVAICIWVLDFAFVSPPPKKSDKCALF